MLAGLWTSSLLQLWKYELLLCYDAVETVFKKIIIYDNTQVVLLSSVPKINSHKQPRVTPASNGSP